MTGSIQNQACNWVSTILNAGQWVQDCPLALLFTLVWHSDAHGHGYHVHPISLLSLHSHEQVLHTQVSCSQLTALYHTKLTAGTLKIIYCYFNQKQGCRRLHSPLGHKGVQIKLISLVQCSKSCSKQTRDEFFKKIVSDFVLPHLWSARGRWDQAGREWCCFPALYKHSPSSASLLRLLPP